MRIRVYYNRKGALPWSVDFGTQDTEVNVSSLVLENIMATSAVDPANQDPNKPSAWLEIADGRLAMQNGVARITRP